MIRTGSDAIQSEIIQESSPRCHDHHHWIRQSSPLLTQRGLKSGLKSQAVTVTVRAGRAFIAARRIGVREQIIGVASVRLLCCFD
jgi:hypothetical protein